MNLTHLSTGVQKRKLKKRVGRGIGSGHGKTGSRGSKGQYASAGANLPGALFTGGQTPIHRRFPKRGFSNATWANVNAEVNVGSLEAFENGAVVDMTVLDSTRIVQGQFDTLRVLGEGELTKKLTVKAHHFTKTAQTKIEATGGKCEVIPAPKRPVRNKMGQGIRTLKSKEAAAKANAKTKV